MLSFIKNRPPLVVISLCILTAASTLTYFAFHISTTDLILDNDVIYVSKIKLFCQRFTQFF